MASELSLSIHERARKAKELVFQTLSQAGYIVAIAASLGISPASVYKIKRHMLEEALLLLYAAGFKVVQQGDDDNNESGD